VVVTIGVGNPGSINMFINGVAVTATVLETMGNFSDWDGGDRANFGFNNGSVPTGTPTPSWTGDLAKMAYYQDVLCSPAEVAGMFAGCVCCRIDFDKVVDLGCITSTTQIPVPTFKAISEGCTSIATPVLVTVQPIMGALIRAGNCPDLVDLSLGDDCVTGEERVYTVGTECCPQTITQIVYYTLNSAPP